MTGQLDMFAEPSPFKNCRRCQRPLVAGLYCSGCEREPGYCPCPLAGEEPQKVTPPSEQSSSKWTIYRIYWLNGMVVVGWESNAEDASAGHCEFESVEKALGFSGVSRTVEGVRVTVKFQGEEVDEWFAEKLLTASRKERR